MNPKRKRLLIIASVYIAGMLSGLCVGAYLMHKRVTSLRNMDGRQRQKIFMARIMERLSLSDEQRKQMQQYTEAMHQVFEKHKTQLKELHNAQRDMYDSKTFDEDAFRQVYRQSAQLKEDIAVQHAIIKHKMNALLTDEQQAEMDTYLSKIKKKFGMRDGKGKGFRGGRDKSPHTGNPHAPR